MPRKKPKKRKNVVTSPAREARQRAQQKWPGSVVVSRNRTAIYHKHPTLPRVMIDAIIGAMHTFGGEEIDTAWRSSISPWNYEVTLSDYTTRVKNLFNTADILQWGKGGQTISFIARQLEWTNDRNDVQLVGNPRAVPVFIDNDRAIWTDAFGSGMDFTWINKTDRLAKLLTIRTLSDLGIPSSQILTGGNPVLRLSFQFSTSNNVDIYVNGVKWNRTGQDETTGLVEFRHTDTGESLWYFDSGKAWDTPPVEIDQTQIIPITRFRKTGPNLFVEIRVPWDYLQSANYPVYIDPTIDVSVGASADDAEESSAGTVNIANTVISNQIDAANEWGAFRFTGITITSYASTLDSYLTFYFGTASADEPDVTIYGEDTASPSQYTAGVGNFNISGRTRTTASADWANSNLGAPGSFSTTGTSFNSIIDELATSYTYSSGVMAFDIKSRAGDTARDCTISTWDNTTDPEPALHIEYSQSAGETKTVTDTGTGNDSFAYPRTLPSGTFPNQTRLLDDFNRASLGSNWTVIVGQPAIVDNKFVGLTSGTVGNTGNEAEWNVQLFGSAIQWYVTIGNLQPSGTVANDVYAIYDRTSSTGSIRLNIYQIYDTLIDRVQLFATSPSEIIFDTGAGDSAFTYSQRSSIRIGISHQNNGYVTVYLDRGNGWEAVGSGFYNGGKFSTGTVRLKLFGYSEDGADVLVPTVNLDDFYVNTLDESSIFVTGSVSELGSGLDTIPQLSSSLIVEDIGSGLDAITVTIVSLILKSIQDTASGLDNISIQASLSASETASGQDIISIQANFNVLDSAVGVDSPQIGASLGVIDIALGGDFLNLSASIPVSDAGIGTDAISVLQALLKLITDLGLGSDRISIQASLSASDIAVGSDSPEIAASLGLTDIALGGDYINLNASIPISELGLGTDRIPQMSASLNLSEIGSASDLLQLLASLSVLDVGVGSDLINVLTGTIKAITDSGLGSDQVSISVSLSVFDMGTGIDALSISVSIVILDTGTGVDAVTVSKVEILLKSISDLASGSDRVSIIASLNIGENSYGIDDPAIQAALGLIDSGAGLESPQISAELSITDTSSATDFLSILQSILKAVTDAGTGTDVITQISASIPVSEIGLGTDKIGQLLATLLITDFGEGVDTVVKFDSTTNILSITFELRKPKIVATLSQPTISIELTKPMVKFSLNL